MKFKSIIIIIFIFQSINSSADPGPNSFYLMVNRNLIIEHSLFVSFTNPAYEAWSNPSNTWSFAGGYSRGLNKSFSMGINAEVEKVQFRNYSTSSGSTASRMVVGFHLENTYPDFRFHLLSGAFINLGIFTSKELELNLNGIEYGLYFGPEYEHRNYAVAVLLRPKFSYFFSRGEAPESVLILNPALSLKFTYTLGLSEA